MFEKIKVRKAAKRRDHQLSAEEEMLLLRCGSNKLIHHYIRKYSFRDEVENHLLELCSDSVIRSYLRMHKLGEEAECKLLDNDVWAAYYIKHHDLAPKGQEQILKQGNSFLCEVYVKNASSFAEELGELFVKTASDELIEEYLKYNALSEEALKTLVKRDAKWLLVYAKNNKLPEEFEASFVQAASDEEFTAYIEDYSFCLDTCLLLLEAENKVKLRKYISKHSLVPDYPLDDPTAEEKLFQSKDKELIREYINLHADEISENGEMELLFSDNDELLKCFIDKAGRFFFSTEEELIQSNKDEIFNYYVERYKFSEENEALLVRSGKKERIEAYIQKYALCPMAENLLILGGDKELIKSYHKKWELRDSSWKVLLETFFLENW